MLSHPIFYLNVIIFIVQLCKEDCTTLAICWAVRPCFKAIVPFDLYFTDSWEILYLGRVWWIRCVYGVLLDRAILMHGYAGQLPGGPTSIGAPC